MNPHLNPAVRHDFVLLFDVTNGNPNGDPDAGNLPRVDPETGLGIVTDVALKRKIRNFVDAYKGKEERYKIYVQQGAILNNHHLRAYTALGKKPRGKGEAADPEARRWMCDNFFDIRAFGAVMSTEVNCGQVRGPVQLTFARSVDRILPMDAAITRVALTRAEEKGSVADDEGEETARSGTIGRKAYIPYGLYITKGFFVPSFAQDTGFSSEDLAVLWTALEQMWDLDRSASRGYTACRGLYVFSHSSPLGNVAAHKLIDRIKVEPVGVARQFSDYTVQVDRENLPEGVTLTQLV
ncbi:type I-C CRISPR-associated protein Cas7/Csd2 [Calidithermus chliarophilus]|uniref:type I-C CRISPR-associated protein Cas7/Csd2 n=1 Tax=Calidithermus chliarophilus TaxID=52023 RepID=UPI00041F5BAA|nr:type I-C CRISPR-associated protein Cas7/Csd2 [Calidithermus chliarophilus]